MSLDTSTTHPDVSLRGCSDAVDLAEKRLCRKETEAQKKGSWEQRGGSREEGKARPDPRLPIRGSRLRSSSLAKGLNTEFTEVLRALRVKT